MCLQGRSRVRERTVLGDNPTQLTGMGSGEEHRRDGQVAMEGQTSSGKEGELYVISSSPMENERGETDR